MTLMTMEEHARMILESHAGLDSKSPHGEDTPKRFLKMLEELTQCAPIDSSLEDAIHDKACIKWKDFPSESDEMVVVRNIPFTSVCNHHVIPFLGTVHIAYVPRETNAGLSKFARVVGHFARQLQVQERMTSQIADYLEDKLSPRGVGVVVNAEHMCMTIRGVQSPGTYTTTSAMRGVFADHERTAKAEFLSLVNGGKR